MIHWSWLIVAFVGGVIAYGMVMLWGELRDRKEEAEIYERECRRNNQWEYVSAKDFKQELELHDN